MVHIQRNFSYLARQTNFYLLKEAIACSAHAIIIIQSDFKMVLQNCSKQLHVPCSFTPICLSFKIFKNPIKTGGVVSETFLPIQ